MGLPGTRQHTATSTHDESSRASHPHSHPLYPHTRRASGRSAGPLWTLCRSERWSCSRVEPRWTNTLPRTSLKSRRALQGPGRVECTPCTTSQLPHTPSYTRGIASLPLRPLPPQAAFARDMLNLRARPSFAAFSSLTPELRTSLGPCDAYTREMRRERGEAPFTAAPPPVAQEDDPALQA